MKSARALKQALVLMLSNSKFNCITSRLTFKIGL